MSRPLRILLSIIGIFVVLVFSAIAAITTIFDPNDYRDDISEAVMAQTGRELRIDGDISLKFFPWLGATLGETSLGNAKGFGPEPFARIGEVGVAVELMPLFRKQVRIDTIYLDGLQLNLAKDAKGRDNWSDMAEHEGATKQKEPTAEQSGPLDVGNASINSVEIRNAAFDYSDAQAGSRYRLEQVSLKTGELRRDTQIDFALSFMATVNEPQLNSTVSLKATLHPDLEAQVYTLDGIKLDVIAKGKDIPGGQQDLKAEGKLRFDQKQGQATFSDGLVRAAGLIIKSQAAAQGINDGKLSYTASVTVQEFSPRALMQKLAMELPHTRDESVLNKATASLELSGKANSVDVSKVLATLDDSQLSGKLQVTDIAAQATDFTLALDSFDVDRYMAPDNGAAKDSATKPGQTSVNDIKIPAEMLDQLNASGTLTVGLLKMQGVKFEQVVLKLNARKGKQKTQELQAKFYGGQITETSRLVPGNPPQYASTVTLGSVNAGDLLKDYMGKAPITGNATMSLDVTSSGHTVGDVRKGLNGLMKLKLSDGAITGYNLAQQLRKAKAMYKGENFSETEAQQTDFADMNLSASIVNGVMKTTDLSAKNPLIRLSGQGQIDLFAETVDFLAKPVVVESSKGQGGAELADLKGLEIPLRISGNWAAPKVKLDVGDALKESLKAKAKEELKGEEDKLKEKLREKLGGFLKGKG